MSKTTQAPFFQREHLNKMAPGIASFNAQKYWECHEELEEVWLEDRGDPARLVYWAVIQVAASLVHYREKNLIGARGMILKAKDKIERCHKEFVLSDLAYQYLDWDQFEKLVKKVPNEPALEDFEELFQFRFSQYLKQDKKPL
jgi:predicted metal-dependent hydrolase